MELETVLNHCTGVFLISLNHNYLTQQSYINMMGDCVLYCFCKYMLLMLLSWPGLNWKWDLDHPWSGYKLWRTVRAPDCWLLSVTRLDELSSRNQGPAVNMKWHKRCSYLPRPPPALRSDCPTSQSLLCWWSDLLISASSHSASSSSPS